MTVGASADPENILLANVSRRRPAVLRNRGPGRERRGPSRRPGHRKCQRATGFTGRLLHRFDPESAARSAEQVYRAMVGALPEGDGRGRPRPAAEDKPALAVTEETANAWGVATWLRWSAIVQRVSVGRPPVPAHPIWWGLHVSPAAGIRNGGNAVRRPPWRRG